MAKTPEAKIKKQIRAILDEYEIPYIAPIGAMYRSTLELDIHACHVGQALIIEAKRPGAKPTAIQQRALKIWGEAGAKCFVIDGPDGLKELRQWIEPES